MCLHNSVKRILLVLLIGACKHTTVESDVVDYLQAHPEARTRIADQANGTIPNATIIKRGDQPLTLLGPTLNVGDIAPDVTIADPKLAPVKLGSLKGKLVVLSVVPSIDTHVCESQTHHVSGLIEQMPPGTEVYTVSRDLPFAQGRFLEEAQTKTKFGSDYHGGEFGRAFGIEVKESGLLARSVWVIGVDGKIVYRELVAEQGQEPDYDAMMAAVKKAGS
jgi:thiol peroxidase